MKKNKKNYPSPPGYDLNAPVKFKLPAALDEISGISYYEKDSSLFAINDEKGLLFKIFLKNPVVIEQWKFSDGGDYEDICLADSSFFVLKSKGKVERFKFSGTDTVGLSEVHFPLTGKNEFETLFLDKKKNKLVIVCKDCESDKKENITSFILDPKTEKIDTSFSIDARPALQHLKLDQKIKPSAGSIHPLTGEIFLISSVTKALIILTPDFTVKQSFALNPKIFKQLEGLAFNPTGDLYISNEAAENGAADILLFKNKKAHQ